MPIPLSQFQATTRTSVPLVSGVRSAYQPLGQFARIAGSLSQDDDAVAVLTRGRASGSGASSNRIVEGVLPGALRSLGDLSSRLSDLQGRLTQSTPGTEGDSQLRAEIGQLSQEYTRIVNSQSFKDVLTFIRAARDGLGRGESANGLYNGAKSGAGLLGNSILGLVQRGDSAALGNLERSLNGLTEITAEQFLSDESISDKITELVRGAFQILSGAGPTAEEQATETQTGQIGITEAPQLKELTFEGANKLALGLRTFSPKDMIKAAASGLSFDANNVLILTISDGEDDRENAKETEPDTLTTEYAK